MDPIAIIKDDHKMVKDLFTEFEKFGDDAVAGKRTVVEQIIAALTMHAEMEETILYPKLRDLFPSEDDPLVGEAYAEHAAAKAILEELKTLEPTDSEYAGKVKALKDTIEHHVREEEGELLPKAKEKLSADDLRVMGEEMTSFRAARA